MPKIQPHLLKFATDEIDFHRLNHFKLNNQ